MRKTLFILFAIATLAGCSPTPPQKQSLPKPVDQMTGDEAKQLYSECTKYGSVTDPRVPFAPEDCAHLYARMNAADLAAAGKYKGSGVGQPVLH
uniref:membrane lipoprotein lipid attachment site-containing protein n=1 Tax=Sulfuriferula sp. GW6 TaxID=3345112 RepID=UPI0039F68066